MEKKNKFDPRHCHRVPTEIAEKNTKAMIEEAEKVYNKAMDLLKIQKGYTEEVEILHDVIIETIRDIDVLKDKTTAIPPNVYALLTRLRSANAQFQYRKRKLQTPTITPSIKPTILTPTVSNVPNAHATVARATKIQEQREKKSSSDKKKRSNRSKNNKERRKMS